MDMSKFTSRLWLMNKKCLDKNKQENFTYKTSLETFFP